MKKLTKSEKAELKESIDALLLSLDKSEEDLFERIYPRLFTQLELLRSQLGYNWEAGRLVKR